MSKLGSLASRQFPSTFDPRTVNFSRHFPAHRTGFLHLLTQGGAAAAACRYRRPAPPQPHSQGTGERRQPRSRHGGPRARCAARTRPPPRTVPQAAGEPLPQAAAPRPPAPLSSGGPLSSAPQGHLAPGTPAPRHSRRRGPTDGAGQAGGPGETGEANAARRAARRPPSSPGSRCPQQQAHGRHSWNWQGGGADGAVLRSGVKLDSRHLGKGQILRSPSGAGHCGRGGGSDGGRRGNGRPMPAPDGRAAADGSAAGLGGCRPPRVGTGAGEAGAREPVGVGMRRGSREEGEPPLTALPPRPVRASEAAAEGGRCVVRNRINAV